MASGNGWREISILLTNDAGIRALNNRYLGRSESTDVLSFVYDPLPGEGELPSAEVVVNVQRAVEEGLRLRGSRRAGGKAWGPSYELALYLAHGCNHLTGMNDDTPHGRQRMRRREMAWVRAAETEGLLEGLVEEGHAQNTDFR